MIGHRPILLAARLAAGAFRGRRLKRASPCKRSSWVPVILRWARRSEFAGTKRTHRAPAGKWVSRIHVHFALKGLFRGTLGRARRDVSPATLSLTTLARVFVNNFITPRARASVAGAQSDRHWMASHRITQASLGHFAIGASASRATAAQTPSLVAASSRLPARHRSHGPDLFSRPVAIQQPGARLLSHAVASNVTGYRVAAAAHSASASSFSMRAQLRRASRADSARSIRTVARRQTDIHWLSSTRVLAANGERCSITSRNHRLFLRTRQTSNTARAPAPASPRASQSDAAAILALKRPMELVWRSGPSADASISSYRSDSARALDTSPRASSSPSSSFTPTSRTNDGAIVRAKALDPALVDRVADDVIRRIDRRVRIERERRGLA